MPFYFDGLIERRNYVFALYIKQGYTNPFIFS